MLLINIFVSVVCKAWCRVCSASGVGEKYHHIFNSTCIPLWKVLAGQWRNLSG